MGWEGGQVKVDAFLLEEETTYSQNGATTRRLILYSKGGGTRFSLEDRTQVLVPGYTRVSTCLLSN